MDCETKERLRALGRLIADLSPRSVQDLGRKDEALKILRRTIEADEPVPESTYPFAVLEAGDKLIALAEGRADGSFLEVVHELYQMGQREGAYQEQSRTEDAKGSPAYSRIGAGIGDRRSHVADAIGLTHVDDIEFFRKGGI